MDRKGRPLNFAIGAVVVSAVALVVVEWPYVRAWYRPPQADLPDPDEVLHMEAAVWASGSQGAVENDLPRFVVPESVAPRLWKRFTPNAYVPRPPVRPDAPLGEVKVTATDGRVTRVLFYESGPDELVFTADGEHFFEAQPRDDQGIPLGGSLLLAGSLRHAAISPMTDPAALDP